MHAPLADEGADLLGGNLVLDEVHSHYLCDHGRGDIIFRGPQATRGEHHLRPPQGDAQRGRQSFRIVADRRLVVDMNSQQGQLLCQICRICVDDLSQQQLGAY